ERVDRGPEMPASWAPIPPESARNLPRRLSLTHCALQRYEWERCHGVTPCGNKRTDVDRHLDRTKLTASRIGDRLAPTRAGAGARALRWRALAKLRSLGAPNDKRAADLPRSRAGPPREMKWARFASIRSVGTYKPRLNRSQAVNEKIRTT